MRSKSSFIFFIILILLTCLLFAAWHEAGFFAGIKMMEKEAIKHNAAEWKPNNKGEAEFTWKN